MHLNWIVCFDSKSTRSLRVAIPKTKGTEAFKFAIIKLQEDMIMTHKLLHGLVGSAQCIQLQLEEG